jgi:SAM-dependent methyltransferase
MMKKKLTQHYLDGDTNLSLIQKIQYSIFFIIEVFQDKRKYLSPAQEPFLSEFLKLYNNNYELLVKKSPSRICCDFNTFVHLKKNFNSNEIVKILDIGCGNGISLDLFSRYFDKFYYKGIDKFPGKDWKIKENHCIKFSTHNLGVDDFDISENYDLIYSQSVFEHVEYDLSGFLSLKKTFPYAKQIHFLPSPLSFLNYLKHGYRRYSYRSLLNLENHLKTKLNIQNVAGKRALRLYFPIYNNITKNKHIFNFLSDSTSFKKNKDYLVYLLRDGSKCLPIFYLITF